MATYHGDHEKGHEFYVRPWGEDIAYEMFELRFKDFCTNYREKNMDENPK